MSLAHMSLAYMSLAYMSLAYMSLAYMSLAYILRTHLRICICLLRICDVTFSWTSYDSFVYVTLLLHHQLWRFHEYHVTFTYMWHGFFTTNCNVFTNITWRLHICDMTFSPRYTTVPWSDRGEEAMSQICNSHGVKEMFSPRTTRRFLWGCCRQLTMYVTWLYVCDMTLSYMWRDSFIYVTWLFHRCDVTLSYMWRDSSINVKWLVHRCDVTISYKWHDAFTFLLHTCLHTRTHSPHETMCLWFLLTWVRVT